MHHRKIRLPESSRIRAWINHNGDWSGDVIIGYQDKRLTSGHLEITVPGEIIRQLMADAHENAIESLEAVLDALKRGDSCA